MYMYLVHVVYKGALSYAVSRNSLLCYCITLIIQSNHSQYFIGLHIEAMAAKATVEELLARNKYVKTPAPRESD